MFKIYILITHIIYFLLYIYIMPRSRSDNNTFLETREERAATLSRSRNLGANLMNILTRKKEEKEHLVEECVDNALKRQEERLAIKRERAKKEKWERMVDGGWDEHHFRGVCREKIETAMAEEEEEARRIRAVEESVRDAGFLGEGSRRSHRARKSHRARRSHRARKSHRERRV